MSQFLIVDTSYCIFYRFFATKRWYSFAYPEEKFNDDYDWYENDIFKNMFEKKFLEQFNKLIKKYTIDGKKIIFAKDCARKNIWRTQIFNEYKDCRKKTSHISKFFKFTYDTILKDKNIVNYDSLEADDCIYLLKKFLIEKNVNNKFIIVTGDYDLLQLIDKNTFIYSLNNKCLNDKCSGDPKFELAKKIICGDKSDNISGCFKRVGPKTLEKIYNDKTLLEEMFSKNKGSKDIYNSNKILIDFTCIPIYLQEKFIDYLEKNYDI